MALFLNTKGRSTLGIGVCARCYRKFSLDDLVDDFETGLKVCVDDADEKDPWRKPPRQTETITLPFVRRDVAMDGIPQLQGQPVPTIPTPDELPTSVNDFEFTISFSAPQVDET